MNKNVCTIVAVVSSAVFGGACGSVVVESQDGGGGSGGDGMHATVSVGSSSSGSHDCPTGQKHCGAECVPSSVECGSCDDGWEDCNGDPSDGCETDTNTSTSNCGACNEVCSLDNSSASCVNRTCHVKTCNDRAADCNGLAPDGCEAETQIDKLNCGGCGVICGNKQACSSGECAACDADINYLSSSSSTFHSKNALVAWMYHPKNTENLRQICIKAHGDGPVFEVGIYTETAGPYMLLQKWQASSVSDSPGVWCTPLLPDGAGFKMNGGSVYWIGTSATEYATAASGENVETYASDGTIESPANWTQQTVPLGIIAKVFADCL